MRPGLAAALAAGVICVVGACNGGREEPPADGPLARALATIGGGGANASLGVGWADPQLVAGIGGGHGLIAAALGPNAGSVVEARPALRRRFGFDALTAERLVAVGGSYAFGLRADGTDGGRLPAALTAVGLHERRQDGVIYVQSGEYAVVPEPLLEAGVRGLGAFDAFEDEATVLAISMGARATLLGRGARLFDQPTYRAAAACLGDVVAARIVPDKLLLSTEQGIELMAAGVGDGWQVLCSLGGPTERADEIAANLDAGLGGAEVSRSTQEGVEVVRAERGWDDKGRADDVFDLVAGADVVELINGAEAGDGP